MDILYWTLIISAVGSLIGVLGSFYNKELKKLDKLNVYGWLAIIIIVGSFAVSFIITKDNISSVNKSKTLKNYIYYNISDECFDILVPIKQIYYVVMEGKERNEKMSEYENILDHVKEITEFNLLDTIKNNRILTLAHTTYLDYILNYYKTHSIDKLEKILLNYTGFIETKDFKTINEIIKENIPDALSKIEVGYLRDSVSNKVTFHPYYKREFTKLILQLEGIEKSHNEIKVEDFKNR